MDLWSQTILFIQHLCVLFFHGPIGSSRLEIIQIILTVFIHTLARLDPILLAVQFFGTQTILCDIILLLQFFWQLRF